MKVILPYRGEFGWICMFHARQARAVQHPHKMVCVEPGMLALYPATYQWCVESPHTDTRRAGADREFCDQIRAEIAASDYRDFEPIDWIYPDMAAPREAFVPEPHGPPGLDPAEVDVVICPRARGYGADKNWPHWWDLANDLSGRGWRVVAAGAADSSVPDPPDGVCSTWNIEGSAPLDATIAAMSGARLVVATDAGLAHLAMLMGTALLLITHLDGLVAPGHDDVGNPYWPVKIDRYRDGNHRGAPIKMIKHAWHRPRLVFDVVDRILSEPVECSN